MDKATGNESEIDLTSNRDDRFAGEMKDDLREQETCFHVIENSVSVVECVMDLVHAVEEFERNSAPKTLPTSDKSDVILTAGSQQQQATPILVEDQEKEQDQQATEVKEKLTHGETQWSVNSLHLLFDEVNTVLTEILENVNPEENVSTQSDSIQQNDGGDCNLSKGNESDNDNVRQQNEEKVECPLDGLRSLLKTVVPQFKFPEPEPSPPSPSVTPEVQDEKGIAAEQKVKKPVDYLQVLRILRPPPPKKTENTQEGEMECMSDDGPNEEEASTVKKKAKSAVGGRELSLSPVKTQETVESAEDRDSTNSDSTIFLSKTLGQSKKYHSEKVTPVLEMYTSINTDSESKATKKQKKEKAIKKRAKSRIGEDEGDRNDSKRNLYAKNEEAKPLAGTKIPVLLAKPIIILSRCDDMVRLSRKRKRSESRSCAGPPSPEKVEVGEDRNSTTDSHSTTFMSSVLQKLRKSRLTKVIPASAPLISKEPETGATKKHEKEKPVKNKTKIILDEDDRGDAATKKHEKQKPVKNKTKINLDEDNRGDAATKKHENEKPVKNKTKIILDEDDRGDAATKKHEKEKPVKTKTKIILDEDDRGDAATKKQEKEKPVKNKTKVNLDEDDRGDANTKSTICLSKEQSTQNHAGKKNSASEFKALDSKTSLDLEKEIKQKGKKAKSAKKKVEGAEKRRKEFKEAVDGKDDSNTSSESESLFSIITPSKSSFADKDRVSESISSNTSKFLFSPVKKKKPSRVPDVEIETKEKKLAKKKTLMTVRNRSSSVFNKEQATVEGIETEEKETKKGSTKVEDASSRSKKKGKESVAGRKRKRSSSPVPSSSAENSDAALMKKWSLKPCHVVLRRDLCENSSLKKKGTAKTEKSVEPKVVINGDEDKSNVMYPCPICDLTYCSSDKLDKHLKKKHFTLSSETRQEEKEVHECAVCGKVFQYASAKRIHVANHFKKKAFRCSICNKRFSLQKALQLHIRMKHEEIIK